MSIEKEDNSKSEYERLVEKQISWLGHLLTWMGIFVVVMSVFITVYSYLKVEAIEEKVRYSIQSYDNKIADMNKKIEDELKYFQNQYYERSLRFEGRTEDKVNYAVKDLESKFDKLSGQALIFPKAELLWDQKILNGAIIEIIKSKHRLSENTVEIDLSKLSIRNVGGKRLEGFNMVLNFDQPLYTNYYHEESVPSEKGIQFRFNFINEIINPDYVWRIPRNNSTFSHDASVSTINCSVEVFYYPEKVKADFIIQLK